MMTTSTMYKSAARPASFTDEQINLVKRIAYRLLGKLPDCVQVEDLMQAGMVGLLEARGRFRSDTGASFNTFAGIRIRGAMLDEIRRGDWTPRSVHRTARSVTQARQAVESCKGAAASDAEIASAAGLSVQDYHNARRDVAGAYLHSLDEHDPDWPTQEVPAADTSRPAVIVEHQDLCDAVTTASTHLPRRDRLLLALYYRRDYNLREIAEKFNISESRACQLHRRAIARLREHLTDMAA